MRPTASLLAVTDEPPRQHFDAFERVPGPSHHEATTHVVTPSAAVDHNALAKIDAVSGGLLFKGRSFHDVDCVYPQIIVGGLRGRRPR
jgi:hypothetical protein